MAQKSPKPFAYPPASPEEDALRRLLIGAILEFGAPHAFESGAMTRAIEANPKTPTPAPAVTPDLDYVMLQEEGNGYSLFAALRTIYAPQTPVEPVRFAAEFFMAKGSAVVDVSIPSRYATREPQRARAYEETSGPHIRVDLITSAKKTHFLDVLSSFMATKDLATNFKPLLAIMQEQAGAKASQPLTSSHMKQLADFIRGYFGDFSQKTAALEQTGPEEIIPETAAEVPQSDYWMRGVGQAAEQYRHPPEQQ